MSIEVGSRGQFDVLVGDEVVASATERTRKILFLNLSVVRPPDPATVIAAVRERL